MENGKENKNLTIIIMKNFNDSFINHTDLYRGLAVIGLIQVG